MSEFSILYKSLHGEQKIKKQGEEEKASSTETENQTKSEAPVNPIKAFIAKIF